MSFILDALRKSEHARQQQTGPGLAEIPVVASRPRSNVWATAAVALLVVNLVGVGVLLVHRANKDAAAPAVATPATGTATAPAGPAPAPAATATAPAVEPRTPAAPAPAAPATGSNPLAAEVEGGTGPDPTLTAGAAHVPAGPPAVTSQRPTGTTRRGSVVYAPIPEAAEAPYTPPAPAVRAAAPARDDLPTADEVSARGGVPELHLDLHVYSPTPQQRFIFVNSRKYREGETLQEGPVVEQITPDGAVLNYGGNRFKLTND
ncbi:MAG TPA: general secretion pathway protein GspB [Steroidobacteraceae bacterium]